MPIRWNLDDQTPFERMRVLNPDPSAKILREMRSGLSACFPEIGEAPFVETWAGMIETSPDVKPIISAVDELPGFGGGSRGIGIAAGLGTVSGTIRLTFVGIWSRGRRGGRNADGSFLQKRRCTL